MPSPAHVGMGGRPLIGLLVRVWVPACTLLAGSFIIFSVAPAQGAVDLQLAVEPPHPGIGTDARIILRTFSVLEGSGTRGDPLIIPSSYPWRVQAASPSGIVRRIDVQRTDDPYVWTGSLNFDESGAWIIEVTNYSPGYDPRAGARLRVLVGDGAAQSSRPEFSFPTGKDSSSRAIGIAVAVVALLSAAVAGYLGVIRARRRRAQ